MFCRLLRLRSIAACLVILLLVLAACKREMIGPPYVMRGEAPSANLDAAVVLGARLGPTF